MHTRGDPGNTMVWKPRVWGATAARLAWISEQRCRSTDLPHPHPPHPPRQPHPHLHHPIHIIVSSDQSTAERPRARLDRLAGAAVGQTQALPRSIHGLVSMARQQTPSTLLRPVIPSFPALPRGVLRARKSAPTEV